jgi:carbon monoxide dehydrogenase subunit G
MSRSVDLTVESPASVEQILSAFGDEVYWHARLSEFAGGTATLGSLQVDDDGTVSVKIRIGLLRDHLPKVVTQLTPGDLQMLRQETWSRSADGCVRGVIAVVLSGAPVSATGQATLSPEGGGSRLNYNATIKVKVPLVGGKIESYMCRQTTDEIIKLQGFTNEWIAGNA